MAISIKKNEYTAPTECREEVVQAICDAFLYHCIWSTFHPYKDGRCRYPTNYVVAHVIAKGKQFYGFASNPDSEDFSYKIRGCEMKQAFQELIKAGYYMFKVHTYGTWTGYVVSDKPYYEGGIQVSAFNDFID